MLLGSLDELAINLGSRPPAGCNQCGHSSRMIASRYIYPADYDLALALVHWLNGDIAEAERLGSRALHPPIEATFTR
jgi:hypothetical protein